MSLITVSREAGSLGDETARLLAKTLSYVLIDRAALESAIDGQGFPEIVMERYDEHTPSFWENFTSGKDVYLDRLRTAMLESAASNDAVILGRGGQFVLANVPCALHVRLIASPEIRSERLQAALKCDRKTADRYCKRSDHDRNGFARFFFGGPWSDPFRYDITLNTDNLTPETAVGIIVAAFKASPACRSRDTKALLDRLTAQRVRNRLLYAKRIPVDLLEVEADDGAVVIKGTVTVKENIARCEEAAREVEGVRSVATDVYFVNPVMTY